MPETKVTHSFSLETTNEKGDHRQVIIGKTDLGFVISIFTTKNGFPGVRRDFGLSPRGLEDLIDALREAKSNIENYPIDSLDWNVTYHEPEKLQPIKPEDDVYTVEEFKEQVGPYEGCWGNISPQEGSGYWANDQGYSRQDPVFALGKLTDKPFWSTKIVWFNK